MKPRRLLCSLTCGWSGQQGVHGGLSQGHGGQPKVMLACRTITGSGVHAGGSQLQQAAVQPSPTWIPPCWQNTADASPADRKRNLLTKPPLQSS